MNMMKKSYLFLLLISVIILLIASCVTGNASAKDKKSYDIGETGPGGGIIFSAENGTYMECSWGLGKGTWDDAQKIINKYRGGKKKDWRLPTVDELELIYKNLKLQDLGGFTMDKYWSSLQENDGYVLTFDFFLGTKDTYKKSFSCSIRAVRAFDTVIIK
jgi:hypothetical protein